MDHNERLIMYKIMLTHYIAQRKETVLQRGQKLSRKMMENGVTPDDVIGAHIDVVSRMIGPVDERIAASLEFLMEVMAGYGADYREYQSLKNRQKQLDTEIDIAADVQRALLEGTVPDCSFADIGVFSEPAKKMSGDYYQFVQGENGVLGVAVADIVGKGIPAAMCMSMIKYAMDSLPENRQGPPGVLASLNRVVERNVDPSMFITMFYGVYDPVGRTFSFSSAGHEPGFYYTSACDRFDDLEARGPALGLSPKTGYTEYTKPVAAGDMIILLTDGVTESRIDNEFIGRKRLIALIRRYMNLPAQELAEKVFYELEKMQDFELHDDFTFIAVKF
ncbi:SpoIIE family protein phosphatase [Sporolactobacillus sp. KGMB 08714]|uniref:SpoIIE family protein phosphatase n=1 Tax=Sporolactobacillus sp. KGMB 08714 TaxID=3064704 RepID=UPI002FBDE04A